MLPAMAKINRREVLLVGAGAALAKTLTVTTACANTGAGPAEGGETETPAAGGGGSPNAEFAAAAAECVEAGRACMQHCLKMLQSGDTMMAECSQAVYEMLGVCEGVARLAYSGSEHLALAARLCEAVCTTCEAACAPHAGHHQECGACAEACRRSIAAAKAIA